MGRKKNNIRAEEEQITAGCIFFIKKLKNVSCEYDRLNG